MIRSIRAYYKTSVFFANNALPFRAQVSFMSFHKLNQCPKHQNQSHDSNRRSLLHLADPFHMFIPIQHDRMQKYSYAMGAGGLCGIRNNPIRS
jgi:hypothetical protein